LHLTGSKLGKLVWMRIGSGVVTVLCLLAASVLPAQSADVAKQIVDTMLAHQNDPGEHRNRYMYLSEERSERTGGHLWRERVIETSLGKVRLLVAEDGRTLSPQRAAAERGRLEALVSHPEAFQRHEQSMHDDELHAEQMLTLLHTAFLFDEPQMDGDDLRIHFRPDPAYQPKTLEERVLHAMTGAVLVDERTRQLHRVEALIPNDVVLGYGILGTIHAGSYFNTTHEIAPGNEWKPSVVNTAIEGKALLFKEIGKNQHVVNGEFKLLPPNLTLAEAVDMLEREQQM
jgi:hypothetical protein